MKTTIRFSILAALVAVATPLFAADAILPLAFEVNEGQWNDEIRFLARGRAGLVALQERGAVLLPSAPGATAVRMEIVGESSRPTVEGIDPLPHLTNHFIGGDPAEWRRNVRSYRRVLYRQVYKGIDAVFHSGPSGELEYDFVVHPGSDPRKIRLRFDGATGVAIDKGDLVIRTAGDSIRMMRPVAYQSIDGNRSEVAVDYQMFSRRMIGFAVGKYDRSRELIIDPVVLGYSTFLGGSGDEIGTSIAVDADRNVYVAGTTMSADFSIKGGIRTAIAGGRDAFVTKLTPAGDRILFSTFIGGSGDETGRPSIAVDSRGDVYLAASTQSADFPTTEGAPQRVFGGGNADAFVLKLSSDGSRLLFSTYLGGEAGDHGNGMAIDPLRDIYVGGATSSLRFPVTAGAYQTTLRGTRNGYVAKLRVDPPSLVYATYLGGAADTTLGLELAVDAAGAAYLTGRTQSADFPTTAGALQTSFGGAGLDFGDGFVSKISPDGSQLVYSTYLGGSSGESVEGIAVDSTGAAFVTGLTYSTNFPTTPGSFQPRHGGGDADNFVAKLSPEGDRLVFSTYLGGNNSEQANAIAADRIGNVHVSGTTSAADFPTTADALSRVRQGTTDGFVSILSRDGAQLLYSTYIGGTAPSGGPQDNLWGLTVDGGGNTWIVGQTRSTDFPVTPGALQPAHRGSDDAYVAKFTAQRQRPEGEMRVIPVVGSTPGALGSFFKTSVQLHNPLAETIVGRLVFHPQGQAGTEVDPWLDYLVAPGETIAISDILPSMGQSGVGSLDLFASQEQVPRSVVRIFNDAGEAGTTGMSEEQMRPAEVLQAGTTGVLIAPPSMIASRFNVGLRTLAAGASISGSVQDADGAVVHIFAREYPADFFVQGSARDVVGVVPPANGSISFRIDSGSAIVYGSTIDNISQDPSLQIARGIDSVTGEMRVLPVVASTPGLLGSFFKTTLQLHNASTSEISGRLVFHRQGASGSDGDPSLSYALRPGQTIAYDDLLPAMGLGGVGSVDLASASGPLPLTVARIFNDAGALGTTGMTQDQIALHEFLGVGDESVLIAPPDPARARFNIGVRTLGAGATITATVRNSAGVVVHTVTKSFPPIFLSQLSAAAFLGVPLRESDTIRLRVDAGSAVVYGATNDNVTQDPSLQIARR
ncbi:MAG TPA: SBBP repeat-containing protein [Thermoanaerobaculia bacterium]|nr:SBBP repeat-containing protein [Thermoanaerobaculia bacterium]